MKGQRGASINPHDQTGSPQTGEPVFLAVGYLRRPHGLHGEILMDVLTDFPERLRIGKEIFVGEEQKFYRISRVRWHDHQMLVSLEGVIDREQAGQFRNLMVYVRADSLPDLEKGEHYFHQLIGLSVVEKEGQLLGKLVEIIETGANDVYVVQTSKGDELLLPAIEDVILGIDLERGEVLVKLQEWS